MKFTVLSPDGIPIAPELYGTQAEAQAERWRRNASRITGS
jgi:hypothetical protein